MPPPPLKPPLLLSHSHPQAVQAERDRLDTLAAKHTMQVTLYQKALRDNAELKELNSILFKDKERLAGQVSGLKEEIEFMHKAWMERDVKQRAQVCGGGLGV